MCSVFPLERQKAEQREGVKGMEISAVEEVTPKGSVTKGN
jgi:hypothetical protein